ncbi:hypothetical protein HGA88_07055 [Candidatus Roizmanbacteria bacterium]|nr:hypothetical protein [Candidatus Roizmanbacteria bacterium]
MTLGVGIDQYPAIEFYTPPEYPDDEELLRLNPDFYFIYKESEENRKHYAGVIQEQFTKPFVTKGRITKYLNYLIENPDTTVIFITANSLLYNYARKYLKERTEDEEAVTRFEVVKQNNYKAYVLNRKKLD